MALKEAIFKGRSATTPTGVAIGVAAICALTLVPAVLQGRFVNRWRVPAELPIAAQAVSKFPERLGAWQAVAKPKPLPKGVVKELGIAGYIERVYRHRDSHERVALLLMVGRPGRLVRHPPEICYGSLANTRLGERSTSPMVAGKTRDDAASQFRVLDFDSRSQIQGPFSVAYGFSTGAEWSVPAWPRLVYGSSPVLYKVQVQAALADDGARNRAATAIDEFLQDFVTAFAEFQQSAPGR